MLGKDRRLIKIGRYPDICLAAARKRAHEIIDDHDPKALTFSAARDLFFAQHLDTLKATTAHGQKAIMRRFPFSKRIGALTLNDVNRVLHDLPRGSARCSFNVIRTFFNWCVANDYLESSPLKKSRTSLTIGTDYLPMMSCGLSGARRTSTPLSVRSLAC